MKKLNRDLFSPEEKALIEYGYGVKGMANPLVIQVPEINKSVDLFGAVQASVAQLWTPGQQFVSMSGGRDSRLILASLLEHTEASNITLINYGQEGLLDFDIVKEISNRLGTRLAQFDFSDTKWSIDRLLQEWKLNTGQTRLFTSYPPELLMPFKNEVIWSGIMGDGLIGNPLKYDSDISLNFENSFVEFKQRTKFANIFKDDGYYDDLFREFLCGTTGIENMPVMQSMYTYGIFNLMYRFNVIPSNFKWNTPFLSRPYLEYVGSLKYKERVKKSRYLVDFEAVNHNMLEVGYKSNLGLKRNSASYFVQKIHDSLQIRIFKNTRRHENYFDLARMYSQNQGFQAVVNDLLCDELGTSDLERLLKAKQGINLIKGLVSVKVARIV